MEVEWKAREEMSSMIKGSQAPAVLSRRASWTSVDPPISQLMAAALGQPELISLAAGFVDPVTLPCNEVCESMQAVLRDPKLGRTALQYGMTRGYQPLRERLVDRLSVADGEAVIRGVDRCVLTAGSNQLLQHIADSLLDPGDIVICAAPTYLVFLGTISGVGAKSWSVEADDRGMIPERLEQTFEELREAGLLGRVKAVYTVSYFDNPSGSEMDLERRQAINSLVVQYSTEQKIYLIDDLAYRDLRYEGSDVPSFSALDPEGDHVIVAGTFSKSFSPGVRVGWGVLPSELAASIERLKGNSDFGSPHLNQVMMHHALESGIHEVQRERLQQAYRLKRDAMLAALERCFASQSDVKWLRSRGGLYVWLTLPHSIDTGPEGRLLNEAIARNVLYVPGQYAFASSGAPVQNNTIRLSFGVQTAERIAEGIERLAAAVDAVR